MKVFSFIFLLFYMHATLMPSCSDGHACTDMTEQQQEIPDSKNDKNDCCGDHCACSCCIVICLMPVIDPELSHEVLIDNQELLTTDSANQGRLAVDNCFHPPEAV